jgi:carboxylesterase type B
MVWLLVLFFSWVNGSRVVETEYGPVVGLEGTAQAYVSLPPGTSVDSFWGIPYAAAPVGKLRWRSPQSPAAWTTAYDGTNQRRKCPQPSIPLMRYIFAQLCTYF